MKIFKNFKENIKLHKRTMYSIKILFILITLGIVLTIISIYRFSELIQDFTSDANSTSFYIFEYLTLLALDFSIILIPTTISLNHIIKSFKEDKNKIFTLLEELIMLRYDISDIPLMIHPTIIRDIKSALRYFGFTPEVEYIHYLIKQNILWHLDIIIKSVILRSKSYDGGKEYRRREKEVLIEKNSIEKMKKELPLLYNQEDNPLRRKCIENLGFVLAYDLYGAGDISIPVSMFYKEEVRS